LDAIELFFLLCKGGLEMPKCQIARFIVMTIAAWAFTGLAQAKQKTDIKTGVLQYAQGEVSIDGTILQVAKGSSVQMMNDQVLITKKGYAELLLVPDVYVRLGEDASLTMRQNEIKDMRLELNQGSALVEIPEKTKTNPISIIVLKTVIAIEKAGLYRLDSNPVALRVHSGEAKLTIDNKKAKIESGEMVYLQDIFKPEKFKPVVADALHQWAARRSYDLCTANIFNTKPKRPENLAWKPTAKAELENIQYHISFPPNADWIKYWKNLADPKYMAKGTFIGMAIPSGDAPSTLDPDLQRALFPKTQADEEYRRLQMIEWQRQQQEQQQRQQMPQQ
jgi:hypothetical protein